MICVSRYNEDLSWTTEYPFHQFSYIVYNKGINENFEKKHVAKVVSLPNVGRCDHTYLHHIVTHYPNLPSTVVFLPGSTEMSYKKRVATKLLLSILQKKRAFFVGCETESIYKEFLDFSQDEYCCQNQNNQSLNSETLVHPCPQRPFGNWFLRHGFHDVGIYCYYGIFSVDKRDILQHPLSRYKQLLAELAVHSNPEVGHYTERAWATIFGPFRYTLFEPVQSKPKKKKALVFTHT